MFTRFIFWPWFAGVVFLFFGFFAVRSELSRAVKLEKLIVLGPVFFAVPLAVFGAEHLAGAQFIMQVVPAWIPWHLFWTYFVGVALIVAAVSLILMKQVRWSATLLTAMFCLFVLVIHLPIVASRPHDRFAWAVAFRDLSFGAGAWALARMQSREWRVHGSDKLIIVSRLIIALIVIFFGVEHVLHPEFAPGVPLPKVTPAWVPLGFLWGYLTGAVLIGAGVAILMNKQARTAAAWLGLLLTLIVLFIYVPILGIAAKPSEMNEGVNYVADTLLFAGTILLLASAMPTDADERTVGAAAAED
jgi:uncharacterized membrane protein